MRIAAGVNGLFLAIVVAAQQWGRGDFWLLKEVIDAPPFIWAVPSLMLILIALIKRQRKMAWANLVILGVSQWILMGVNLPLPESSIEKTASARVLSYNIQCAKQGIEPVVGTIQRLNADLICLQETQNNRMDLTLPQTLRERFPGWHIAEGGDVMTLSRFPILATKTHALSPKTNRVILETTIEVQGERLTVLNLHYAVKPSHLLRSQMSLADYFHHKAALAEEQTQSVLQVASQTSAPFILVGDFNLPARGILYREFSRRYRDAFRAVGWGPGYTILSRFPYARIDYVWLSEGVSAKRCYVVFAKSSDHFPLIAEIAWEYQADASDD